MCLAGLAISVCLSGTPERAFWSLALGFGCGLASLSCVGGAFWFGARAFVSASGPEGAVAYRVVNTLDSHVGYRGRYEWFGKPSARVDDVPMDDRTEM